MSSDFQHYSFRMPNIGFQNLPLNIYIVVFGTAIFVFILSLLFCCYLIRLRHQAHKELYAYKQVILKEKVKELNLHELGREVKERREEPWGVLRLLQWTGEYVGFQETCPEKVLSGCR
ncbi:PREDICTED: RING finger protein 24-like, partial [Cariama cristata]|uniref:RING finger protein 24-like n=1 Tax=Cariama cristata TaxID=54380 RepID=UPI00051FF73F